MRMKRQYSNLLHHRIPATATPTSFLRCIHNHRPNLSSVTHIYNTPIHSRNRWNANAATTRHIHSQKDPSNKLASVLPIQYNRNTGILSSPPQDGNRPLFQTVIGIEIHAQLSTPTKLFSNGRTKHLQLKNNKHNGLPPIHSPNTAIDLHDIAYPGTLPLISHSAVKKALIACAALQCDIPPVSRFERKHYQYADLPLGYQVTQQRWPLARDGVLHCRRFVPQDIMDGTANKNKKSNKKTNKRPKGSIHETENEEKLSKFLSVGIHRIQLEQDTGKTTTSTSTTAETISYIDFNRAGSTLIEIVFLPQIKSAHEAASVVSTLQSLLQYLNVCDGKMEEGSLRCDLNISIAPIIDNMDPSSSSSHPQQDDLDLNPMKNTMVTVTTEDGADDPFAQYLPPGVGNRVEVKNLNSVRQIIQATEYEAIQQASLRLEGTDVLQETKTFLPKSGVTETIRTKGGAVDYRFLPEPDLPPLRISHVLQEEKEKEGSSCTSLEDFLEAHLPELPDAAVERLIQEYGILEKVALVLTADRQIIQFYEDAVKHCVETLGNDHEESVAFQTVSMNVANWMCNDLFALLKEGSEQEEVSMGNSNVCATNFGSLVALVLMEHVSTTQGKQILKLMQRERINQTPFEIAQYKGLKLIKNEDELKALCEAVVLDPAHEKQLGQYRQGGKHLRKMAKFFAGRIMAKSKGNAHPKLMQDILGKVLEETTHCTTIS